MQLVSKKLKKVWGRSHDCDLWFDCSAVANWLYQLPPTEVGGLFLSSVVERLKADSLPKDSVL